jgi:hypothetical protein
MNALERPGLLPGDVAELGEEQLGHVQGERRIQQPPGLGLERLGDVPFQGQAGIDHQLRRCRRAARVIVAGVSEAEAEHGCVDRGDSST